MSLSSQPKARTVTGSCGDVTGGTVQVVMQVSLTDTPVVADEHCRFVSMPELSVVAARLLVDEYLQSASNYFHHHVRHNILTF